MEYSFAEGSSTTASGNCSHAECDQTKANGNGAHAEGVFSEAKAYCSHAEGEWTLASSVHQHTQGKYNIEDTEKKYAHIVGNGTGNTKRSNAHTLDWSGNAWYAGNVYVGGTRQDEGNKLLSTADIHFDESGNLVVKIGDISKTFAPVQ